MIIFIIFLAKVLWYCMMYIYSNHVLVLSIYFEFLTYLCCLYLKQTSFHLSLIKFSNNKEGILKFGLDKTRILSSTLHCSLANYNSSL